MESDVILHKVQNSILNKDCNISSGLGGSITCQYDLNTCDVIASPEIVKEEFIAHWMGIWIYVMHHANHGLIGRPKDLIKWKKHLFVGTNVKCIDSLSFETEIIVLVNRISSIKLQAPHVPLVSELKVMYVTNTSH